MKVIVCGGAGYIGSVVARQLQEAGHNVIVLDNLSKGHEDAVAEGIAFIKGNIEDFSQYFTTDSHIDAVVHLAAYSAVAKSVKDPYLYWHNNTIGSLKLLEGMRTAGIKNLIFSSTAAVYGDPTKLPIDETATTNPTNPYGMTKLAIDMAITSACSAYGLAATSLRYFNVAGAYGAYGERHTTETHIIPLAFGAIQNSLSFKLFGEDYPTKDGTCVRDYIHVSDLAQAHILALGKLTPGTHTIYNLGNGVGFSNREIVDTISRVTGKNFDVTIDDRREGDPAILIASNEKAKRELGWEPRVSDLDTIIQDAWKFYKNSL